MAFPKNFGMVDMLQTTVKLHILGTFKATISAQFGVFTWRIFQHVQNVTPLQPTDTTYLKTFPLKFDQIFRRYYCIVPCAGVVITAGYI